MTNAITVFSINRIFKNNKVKYIEDVFVYIMKT